MVYIEWKQFGICNFFMLGRECRYGTSCRFAHPEPAEERQRLWDKHTAEERAVLRSQAEMLKHIKGNREEETGPESSLGSMPIEYGPRHNEMHNQFPGLHNQFPGMHPPLPEAAARVLVSQGVYDLSSFTSQGYQDMSLPDERALEQQQYSPMEYQSEQYPAGGPVQAPGGMGETEQHDVKSSPVSPPRLLAASQQAARPHLSGRTGNTLQPSKQHKPHKSAGAAILDHKMAGIKRQSNGEARPVGPHPSTIKVATPYQTQNAIERKLQAASISDTHERAQLEAREDTLCIQGVAWIDSTRRALTLPIRTFTTACVHYHKFRLAHPTADYNWADAAAASLLTACKVEDTLKKSRDILAAAYNLKVPPHEQLSTDDAFFEAPSRIVIGLERLVLEAGGFDFRSRHPHDLMAKIGKGFVASGVPPLEAKDVSKLAWNVLTDMHRTFAPLKQTSATMSIAALETAAKLKSSASAIDAVQALDLKKWGTTREEVMETLLDLLDLYSRHTTHTTVGQEYSLDDFLRLRLALNKECNESSVPRYTTAPEPAADRPARLVNTSLSANGHPTPVSPPQLGTQQTTANASSNAPKDETLRFMLNPHLAAEEQQEVQKYFVEEYEEYEEEIEVPNPSHSNRSKSRSPAGSGTGRSHTSDRREREGGGSSSRRSGSLREERDRERERLRERERELERERARMRERERGKDRGGRYDDRRYEDRQYDRRYDDRRGGRY